MSDIKLDELLIKYKQIAHKLIYHEANIEGSELYHIVNHLISTNADLNTVANEATNESSGLDLQRVSNNEVAVCAKCKDTGIYFYSDRVPETCECKKGHIAP